MQKLQCTNCDTPLKIKRKSLKQGYVICSYCGARHDLGLESGVEKTVRTGLMGFVENLQRKYGTSTSGYNQPGQQPPDTKITIENYPGHSFVMKVPPGGFSGGKAFLTMFTVFWVGFMIVWNGIGITQGQWEMVAFGIIHDLVGAGLLLALVWSYFGVMELSATDGWLTITRRLFGWKREKKFDLADVEDFTIQVASRTNNRPNPGLYMLTKSKRKRIASSANLEEQQWIRTELLKFVESCKE